MDLSSFVYTYFYCANLAVFQPQALEMMGGPRLKLRYKVFTAL
jgi:hypothetical protein